MCTNKNSSHDNKHHDLHFEEQCYCMFITINTTQGFLFCRLISLQSSRQTTVTCPGWGHYLFAPTITHKCDQEQAFRHTATTLLLHKHRTAHFIYPPRTHCMLSVIQLPSAESLQNKEGANRTRAPSRAPSLLCAQSLTETLNTD